MTKEEFQRYQEQTFDSFAKRLIRNESIDAHRELARQGEREISLSSLPCNALPFLSHEDKYLLEKSSVHIKGVEVTVFDRLLGQAMMSLAPKWREVIVMYYFGGMTDEKISAVLQLTAGAIRHRRHAALKRLKAILEDMDYER